MRTRIATLILAAGLLLPAAPAGAVTDEEVFRNFRFNFVNPGGRAVAMGGAFVGIADDATASAVEATVDMSSVDTNNTDRDAHLLSTDFFNAEAHPQMSFRSTSVSADSLDGELTINGVTKPVAFDLEFHGVAVDGYDTTRAGFSASTRILRSDYGIDFNAPLGADGMLIGDKIDIELEIQAVPA